MERDSFTVRRLAVVAAAFALMIFAGSVQAQCTNGACWNANADNSRVWTSNPNANLGVGFDNPNYKLILGGAQNFKFVPNPAVRLFDFDFNHFYSATQANNGAAFRIDLRWDIGQPAFMWMARQINEAIPGGNETVKMVLMPNGNLGIGVLSPTNKLDVAGNANITGTVTGGNIQAKYQDVAEWVPAEEEIPAATVVVLDPERSNHVMASLSAYDQAVAGVISARPGITLGEASDSKVKVATTGRVKVKVDATTNPIKIGDLLVTSDKPGVAMKSIPVDVAGIKMHRPGTVIGKALEPKADGEGEILVLLSLQ
ncbi:MAG: hypothetical protein JOZ54_07255 [Acidobacteria bacterium]|nr:hypothetical protein [Acidobacteriota bacterium]